MVHRLRPGTATFRLMPSLDHHFTHYPSREAAFHERGGTPDPALAVATILDRLRTLPAWLRAGTVGLDVSPAATAY